VSEFDLLIDDLRRVQEARHSSQQMTKALPSAPADDLHSYAPLQVIGWSDMQKSLTVMGDSLRKANAAGRAEDSRTRFFKAYSVTRAALGKRIAQGKISADAAIALEARLNRLYGRALEIVAAEAVQ
jgi:hypothetical protein